MNESFESKTLKIEKSADPIKSSVLVENLKLKEKIKGKKYKKEILKILKEENTGDEFIEKPTYTRIGKQNSQVEHFITLLTKGILHISDFIKKDEKYFSKIINLEKVTQPNTGELEAEIFLIRYLFGDWDKKSYRNLRKDNEGKFVHYDYGEGFRKSRREKKFSYHRNNDVQNQVSYINKELYAIKKYGENRGPIREAKTILNLLGFNARSKMPEAENELGKKAEQILEALENKEFFEAIVKKSEIDMMNERFNFLKQAELKTKLEEFRQIIITRLNLIISLLKERKK